MNNKKTIYITTAIDYVNAKPHVGHAVEKIQADVLARWQKDINKNDVYFLTGSDENSLKNVQAAKKENLQIKEFVDKNVEYFKALKKDLNLSYDQFFRTTEKKHLLGAQKLWESFKPEDIYKKNYKGLYCVGCEEFKLPKDLIDGKCPEHGTAPETVEEENYFFKLSNYQDELYDLIDSGKLKIIPDFRKNEMLSFIKSGLNDFSISRSVKRAEGWGVPVPNDPDQIMYVWVDALSNYITGIDYAGEGELYKKYWENSDERIHVIGKGILRFHAIYWTSMLLSAKLPLPTKIVSHEYLTINNQKISKSVGNVLLPEELVEKFGTDGARYILLSSLPYSRDGDISWDKMVEKYNADLANNLGNLVQRVISMINKYDVKISREENYYADILEDSEADELPTAKIIYDTHLQGFDYDVALQSIWKLIDEGNVFIDEKKPWLLAKAAASTEGGAGAPASAESGMRGAVELERVLNVSYWRAFAIADLLLPFLPETSEKIKKQLETLKPEAIFPRVEK